MTSLSSTLLRASCTEQVIGNTLPLMRVKVSRTSSNKHARLQEELKTACGGLLYVEKRFWIPKVIKVPQRSSIFTAERHAFSSPYVSFSLINQIYWWVAKRNAVSGSKER